MRLEEKKRMLAIEISNREFVMLEYLPGTSPLKVTNFARATRPGGEPAEVARFLGSLLEEQGFVARKAKVVITGPAVEHRTMFLPRTSDEERHLLVMKKLEEELSLPLSELSISSKVVGSAHDRGAQKDEVLVVSTPAFEVKRTMFTLIEAGLEPVVVTSLPVACSTLQPRDEKDDSLAFVCVAKEKSFITVASNLSPRFAREMQISLDDFEVPEEIGDYQSVGGSAPVSAMKVVDERIVTELTRSFLYFKQLSRGGNVKRVYLFGDYSELSLAGLISERLAVTTGTLEDLFEGSYDLVGAASEKSIDFSSNRFPHLVGFAIVPHDREEINLLPVEYTGRKKRLIGRAMVMASAAAYLIVNAFLIIGFITAKNHYRSLMTQMEIQTPIVRKNSEFAMKIFELREKARLSEEILEDLRHPFTRWDEYFGSISSVTPRSVTFSMMNISRGAGSYSVRLTGIVSGKNPQDVQDLFNGFYRSLKKNPLIEGSRYVPVEIFPVKNYKHKYEEKFILNLQLLGEEI